MNDVTMLVEFVPEVVLTGILDDIATFVRFELNCRQNLNKFIFIKKIYNDFELTFYKGLVILLFMPSFCFLQLVNLGIMVETVLYLVLPTVRHVDTQMVCVRVVQVGWVTIAQ